MKLHPLEITHPEEGQPQTLAQLGFVPGIYFLMDWEMEVLYIGQSRCIAARIVQHRRAEIIPFAKVAWFECEEARLLEVEAEKILEYLPTLQVPSFRATQKLLREAEAALVEF